MQVKFKEADGAEHQVEAQAGHNVMEVALRNGVPGIDADCGGNAACGTCHVLVDQSWADALGTTRDEAEEAMLELIQDVQPNSRLACQIILDQSMDGLILHLPEAQF